MTTATPKLDAPLADDQLRFDRAPISGEPAIVKNGGRFDAGVIEGVSLIARGEALGHGMWIDSDMVDAVAEFARGINDAGVKSRFTHPSMSQDGMGRHLGRIHDVDRFGDKVIGDLHFAKSSHKTPDGDLAEYVMTLTAEDSAAAGLSIVFERDLKAETEYMLAHGAVIDDWGHLDLSEWKSPDPDNTENMPHVRLKTLRAADVVDEPAANPDGMFDRQPTARDADALLAFAFGLNDEAPAGAGVLGVDPKRAQAFVSRWCNHHGVSLTKGDEPMTKDANPAPQPEAPTRESFAAELNRYTQRFGAERGAQLFADGTPYDEALEAHADETAEALAKANERIAELEAQLANVELGETEPVETDPGAGKKVSAESIFAVPKEWAAVGANN